MFYDGSWNVKRRRRFFVTRFFSRFFPWNATKLAEKDFLPLASELFSDQDEEEKKKRKGGKRKKKKRKRKEKKEKKEDRPLKAHFARPTEREDIET